MCSRFFQCCCFLAVVVVVSCGGLAAIAQDRSVARFHRDGVVLEVGPQNIKVQHDDGQELEYVIRTPGSREPTKIKVRGSLPVDRIETGAVVGFEVGIDSKGRTVLPVKEILLDAANEEDLKVSSIGDGRFEVVGLVIRKTSQGHLLRVPKTRATRKRRLEIKVSDDTKIKIDSQVMDRVAAGDTVENMMGVTYASGSHVIQSLEIEVSNRRPVVVKTLTPSEKLEQKYSYLPKSLVAPREIKSKYFKMTTDISEMQAKVLKKKLESTYLSASKYYRKKPTGEIHLVVVADPSRWDNETLPAHVRSSLGKKMIGAGLSGGNAGRGFHSGTASRGFTARRSAVGGRGSAAGRQSATTVYSDDDHCTAQEKLAEAFCREAFGSTGPAWYTTGMRQVHTFCMTENDSIFLPEEMVDALQAVSSPRLDEVTGNQFATSSAAPSNVRAQSLQWALCHLLVHNGNYSKAFRKFGIEQLMGRMPHSLEETYGEQLPQLAFEFRQFVNNVTQGYRVNLCKWDWETSADVVYAGEHVKSVVRARAGWQATKLQVEEGKEYDFAAKGEWTLSPEGEPTTASGLNGEGVLVAAIMNEYDLSEPIELDERGSFVAPVNGQVFLRCRDDWGSLDDNDGNLNVYFRLAK